MSEKDSKDSPTAASKTSSGEHVHGPNCNHGHHDHGPLIPITRQAPKIGRNDPCTCGSKKKFKHCCGKS